MQVAVSNNMTGIEQSMFALIGSVTQFGDQLLKGEIVHTGGKWVYGEKAGAAFSFRWEDKARKLKVTYFVNDLHDEQTAKDIHDMVEAYNKIGVIPVIRQKVEGEWVDSELAALEVARLAEVEALKAKKVAKKAAAKAKDAAKKDSEFLSAERVAKSIGGFFGDLAEKLGGPEGRRRFEDSIRSSKPRTAAVNDSQEVVVKTEAEAVTPAAEAPVETKEVVADEAAPVAKEVTVTQADIPPAKEEEAVQAAETSVQEEPETEAEAPVKAQAKAEEKPVKARKPRTPSKVLPTAKK